MNPSLRTHLAIAGAAGVWLLSPLSVGAAKTAFRITDLDWRDPHVFVNFISCQDVTDNALAGSSVNGDLQTSIQTDGDGDGKLDLSYLIIFDPLDQAGSGGTLAFGLSSCTAPVAGTTCEQNPLAFGSYPYVNGGVTCLGVITGTTRPYNPSVVTATSPCFVATIENITLDVGFTIPLSDVYLAATYVGSPATSMVNGLIRGFLSETDANSVILPATFPVVGGQPLSILLAGGDPPGPGINCRSISDKDVGPGGVPGWYMYFNFTASAVPYSDLATSVGNTPVSLELADPRPNPFNPATVIRYTLSETASVRLNVYDPRGRLVTRLVDGVEGAGEHETTWDGRDMHGTVVGSGVYFVHLESRGETRVRKIVLLK
jgi:hypothetical protein